MIALSTLVAAFFTARTISATTYSHTTTFTFTGTALPPGITADSGTIGAGSQYPHQYVASLATVSGGYLNLLVPGGQQNTQAIACAEVATTFTVSAARVDTYAILTNVAGVCNGMFMYGSDTQETDIEWLSDPNSKAYTSRGLARSLQYTNQNTTCTGCGSNGGNTCCSKTGPGVVPSDATTNVHKYSIDWSNGQTSFFVDDVTQYQYTQEVPTTKAGHWTWNNWSNRDPQWSVGPPASNAVFKIQKIVMQYNS